MRRPFASLAAVESRRPCLRAGGALPGAVERRAVGDAGADDRQASVMFTAACMPSSFQRDVALVVIHGDDGVEFAVAGTHHERVGGEGAGRVDAGAVGFGNRGRDDRLLLVAEQAVFAGVRIQSTTASRGASRPADASPYRPTDTSIDCGRRHIVEYASHRLVQVTWATPKPYGARTCSPGGR